ncbi:unnamed protein product [Haemonchus placei]|uniref:Uncharacterized protein n=1 Tax=Haemonchus placei TaxID=6290 RepID=A0A0N4W6I0_HAEPC|nr:unnamed protein product [Haemonchus placei]
MCFTTSQCSHVCWCRVIMSLRMNKKPVGDVARYCLGSERLIRVALPEAS